MDMVTSWWASSRLEADNHNVAALRNAALLHEVRWANGAIETEVPFSR
jgi:hypothetical protein